MHQIVVFDLGGVLARINHTWEEAARVAGVPIALSQAGITPLDASEAFVQYQSGRIDFVEYGTRMAAAFECSIEEAHRIHLGILVGPYEGTEELIDDLHANGVATGCLSNTNAPHWEDLALNGRFPAIQRIQRKMASHLVGMAKPDPGIYRYYAQTHGVEPEQVVFFDDNAENVLSARSVGFRAHRIDPLGDPVAQMRGILVSEGMLPPLLLA